MQTKIPSGLVLRPALRWPDLGAKGGRYEFGLTQELVKTFAEIGGLKPE